MLFTPEHEELRRSLQKFIAAEVNPHVDEWEEAGIFPAHECSRRWASWACSASTSRTSTAAGPRLLVPDGRGRGARQHRLRRVPMAIGVQTDMATPALARWGSDELRTNSSRPSIAGEYVACLGV